MLTAFFCNTFFFCNTVDSSYEDLVTSRFLLLESIHVLIWTERLVSMSFVQQSTSFGNKDYETNQS